MKRQRNTPYALLGLLCLQPMSGYDIRRELRQTMAYLWNESYGQIYPALRRLTSEGLIAPVKSAGNGARIRHAYMITPKGRAHLRDWLALPPRTAPIRNEFLLKLFLSRFAPARARGDHLRRFRIEQNGKLAQFQAIRKIILSERRGHPDLKLWLTMLNHGMRISRTEISWCDQALRNLCPASKQQKKSAARPPSSRTTRPSALNLRSPQSFPEAP